MHDSSRFAMLSLAVALGPSLASAGAPDHSQVPGVVITHSPASSRQYLGSPGIAALGDGVYLAKCDLFGPGTTEHVRARSRVFRSGDAGRSWNRVAEIDGLFWASVFSHRGAAYLFGTDRHHGRIVILRSDDEGRTWTQPSDEQSGLLADGLFHTAPVPVVVHDGRLWRAMEDATGGEKWGERYRAFMMSAPAEADLLDAKSWTRSNLLARDPAWLEGQFGGWLEGNAVVTPDGRIVNILRVDHPDGGRAAVVEISGDGRTATFDPATGFIDFPGGAKKFTIRFDPESKRYWSLTNWIPPKHAGQRAPRVRNTLALVSSADLREWTVRSVVLYHPDVQRHAFQYVDWLFEGDDLIAASRTAHDDGLRGAHNAHDANYLTFHRIHNFRELELSDSIVDPATIGSASE
ncbi:MAG TPA: sialidase family protein [Planctomycetaceae bacterium]|nr:sialidase family protein [Planctomycetaceae bacterium]